MVKFKDFSRRLSVFPVLFKANLTFKDYKDSPVYSSTFQACVNPVLKSMNHLWFTFFSKSYLNGREEDKPKAISFLNLCKVGSIMKVPFLCLFDLILYVPSTIFQLYRDESSWVETVLS